MSNLSLPASSQQAPHDMLHEVPEQLARVAEWLCWQQGAHMA